MTQFFGDVTVQLFLRGFSKVILFFFTGIYVLLFDLRKLTHLKFRYCCVPIDTKPPFKVLPNQQAAIDVNYMIRQWLLDTKEKGPPCSRLSYSSLDSLDG